LISLKEILHVHFWRLKNITLYLLKRIYSVVLLINNI